MNDLVLAGLALVALVLITLFFLWVARWGAHWLRPPDDDEA